jgi:hypothetical protein
MRRIEYISHATASKLRALFNGKEKIYVCYISPVLAGMKLHECVTIKEYVKKNIRFYTTLYDRIGGKITQWLVTMIRRIYVYKSLCMYICPGGSPAQALKCQGLCRQR